MRAVPWGTCQLTFIPIIIYDRSFPTSVSSESVWIRVLTGGGAGRRRGVGVWGQFPRASTGVTQSNCLLWQLMFIHNAVSAIPGFYAYYNQIYKAANGIFFIVIKIYFFIHGVYTFPPHVLNIQAVLMHVHSLLSGVTITGNGEWNRNSLELFGCPEQLTTKFVNAKFVRQLTSI